MAIRYIITLFILLSLGAQAQTSYLVMSSTESSIDESIDLSDLRDIYLGNRIFWRNGDRIFPAHTTAKSNNITLFLKKVLYMSPRKYNKYWRRRLFSGKGHPPKELENDKNIIDYVKKTEGAIGLISQVPSTMDAGLFYFAPDNDGYGLKQIK
ncbi:hypothetical protein A9Q84_19135 [Halobacteriovorax marinus]|uniref:PBP domain-containing protein n=1 Tax=Halobacteriovorax marinus TaxID=97084 RepID=A0A1Y5F2F3_9BACT|nr:hypothetical protein A9Q84_19135 [Halobacteriovorax marinus]